MKYKKNPIEVEAMQFTDAQKDVVYGWAKDIQANVYHSFDKENNQPVLLIPTLEGEMICSLGDYIIVEPFPTDWRKLYPCKPSIFESTYAASPSTGKEVTDTVNNDRTEEAAKEFAGNSHLKRHSPKTYDMRYLGFLAGAKYTSQLQSAVAPVASRSAEEILMEYNFGQYDVSNRGMPEKIIAAMEEYAAQFKSAIIPSVGIGVENVDSLRESYKKEKGLDIRNPTVNRYAAFLEDKIISMSASVVQPCVGEKEQLELALNEIEVLRRFSGLFETTSIERDSLKDNLIGFAIFCGSGFWFNNGDSDLWESFNEGQNFEVDGKMQFRFSTEELYKVYQSQLNTQ